MVGDDARGIDGMKGVVVLYSGILIFLHRVGSNTFLYAQSDIGQRVWSREAGVGGGEHVPGFDDALEPDLSRARKLSSQRHGHRRRSQSTCSDTATRSAHTRTPDVDDVTVVSVQLESNHHVSAKGGPFGSCLEDAVVAFVA